MTPTVAEPIRDDESATDIRLQLVPCDKCVHGVVTVERRGIQRKHRCGACKRNAGWVFRGEAAGDRYALILDYCAGMYACCHGAKRAD